MGYDYDELFPGRFLKSGQFKGKDVTLTISGVRLEDLPQENGQPRTRGILAFEKTKLELVLNRTNGECLREMFGRNTDNWIGKRVTFYPATIHAFGATETAIRVRGSPDLEKDMSIDIQLPRKKPIRATMKKTGTKNGKKAEAAPAPAPEPEHDPDTGEVPFDDEEAA